MPDLAASESAPRPAAAGLHGAISPSRVRYRILALLCGLSMITYLDRACLGAAAPSLVAELSLTSEAELKWAFAAFAIAYALFEIPSGWLGDVLGPRGTLLADCRLVVDLHGLDCVGGMAHRRRTAVRPWRPCRTPVSVWRG